MFFPAGAPEIRLILITTNCFGPAAAGGGRQHYLGSMVVGAKDGNRIQSVIIETRAAARPLPARCLLTPPEMEIVRTPGQNMSWPQEDGLAHADLNVPHLQCGLRKLLAYLDTIQRTSWATKCMTLLNCGSALWRSAKVRYFGRFQKLIKAPPLKCPDKVGRAGAHPA